MLNKMIKLLDNLQVYPENMMKNLNLTRGLVFSQAILLKLTDKGMLREDAYKIVQQLSHSIWNTEKDFHTVVRGSEEVKKYLSEKEIDSCFDLRINLRNVDQIFMRVGIL